MHQKSAGGNCTGFSTFFIGAVIGAGIALIIAPTRGLEVRNIFRRYASELKNGITRQASELSYGKSPETLQRNEQAVPPFTSAQSPKEKLSTVAGSPSSGKKQQAQSSGSQKVTAQTELDQGQNPEIASSRSMNSARSSGQDVETSVTGIPNPSAHPREYKEVMKKYDTPDGNT